MKFRYLFIAGLLLAGACSTKKDTLINRHWHALHTEYNILYNGNLAFEKGRESLNDGYKDNYWEVLPIERLELTETIRLDSEGNDPNFLIAEEKATKAIQLHGMEINGTERNPQIDEAFLLLGKARYFDQRYVPALEAFNYILRRHPESDKLVEARIWREKTNIRLENEDLALRNLKRLLRYEDLNDENYTDTHAMMAQAYMNLEIRDTAVYHLKQAAANAPENNRKGRYLFILGQLYDQMDYSDSANIAYQEVIDLHRRTPRVYYVNAKLGQLRNTPLHPENREFLRETLVEMEENRENRPFLDKIYREKAIYHMAFGEDSLALSYYDRSLRSGAESKELLAFNYEDLANYYFDRDNYRVAGAYYDSVLPNLEENGRRYRGVSKKIENLEEVVQYENIVKRTDSIIRVARMEPGERKAYFEAYIDSLKAAEEAKSKLAETSNDKGFAAFGQQSNTGNGGKFYFYNVTSLGYGRNQFRQRWGQRELEDNWRWSQTRSSGSTEEEEVVAQLGDEPGIEVGERFDLEAYLRGVPEDPAILDSLARERNFANYQLGLLYKEKFNEPALAAARLKAVLEGAPEERLLLPSKYNLYKIYEATGNPLAIEVKQDIIQRHPGTRYAEILLNPQAILAIGEDSPEARYAKLYKLFQDQEYLQVITGTQAAINTLAGDPMVAKFELLKANAIGRLQGFPEFKEALNYVALNYPNLEEGKKARQIVDEQLPALEDRDFYSASQAKGKTPWKLVFPLQRSMDMGEELKEKLDKALKDLNYRQKVSIDVYDLEKELVVVHGFQSRDFALGFAELLNINRKYGVDRENFVILSDNYKVIQVHKNLDAYLRQILTPKP